MKPRISQNQKDFLLKLIGTGAEFGEINAACANFDEPFTVSRQKVDYYRQSRGYDLEKQQRSREKSAFVKGFAQRERRIESLDALAQILKADLTENDKLWIASSMGGEQFNRAEVEQFRGVLDDIAKEVGERRSTPINVNLTAKEIQNLSDDELDSIINKANGK